jgi:hypothetical protein
MRSASVKANSSSAALLPYPSGAARPVPRARPDHARESHPPKRSLEYV